MSKLAKALTAAAGNAGESLYVEDVFSTYLYTGNSANQNIVNGIDLAGEGGMVWTKRRDNSQLHGLFDTERGVLKYISSDRTDAETTAANTLKAFNSDGFQLGGQSYPVSNSNGDKGVSWTFRKAEKFFDVVTYTGNGSTQNIAHNLGSVPAVIIVKGTTTNNSWCVYSSALGNTKTLFLDLTSAETTNASIWNSTTPTDSVFSVGNVNNVNESGQSFVAYLFASDAGGFGDDGSESIIKCGSFTTDGSGLFSVTLGFEPQWILVKRTSGTGNWFLVDAMRGLTAAGIDDALLLPNSSSAEIDSNWFDVTATGFNSTSSNPDYNSDYIYIAIRRPMKTPESGTEVYGASQDSTPTFSFPPDLGIIFDAGGGATYGNKWTDRLRGSQKTLQTSSTAAEVTESSANTWYTFNSDGTQNNFGNSWGGPQFTIQGFKRATGFFDVVAYTGTGVARTVNHNLGVVPELMILKVRNRAGSSWVGYHKDLGNEGGFSLTNFAAFSGVTSAWNSTTPTSSVFTVGTGSNYNGNTDNLIAYLFATLAGVSKVGSYTGTGSNVDVDCGFSAGARFILIKRTDSTGDWYVYDSVRGIVAGNDPYLLLNSTAAEVTSTDYIDPLASGFTVTSSAPAALNASGGTYIFLAIA
jgi:hypothetical protein